jgi:two-component system LytT family sensor kinase
MDQRFILITLLVKLGVAAAVASALVRSKAFKRNLFREERTLGQKLFLVFFAGLPFALGVLVRGSVHNFLAADLSFEATVLIGVIGGRVAGMSAGLLMALPALLHGEVLNLPFNVFAGLISGILRNLARDYEAVWTFTPFLDLSVYRWLRRNVRRPQLDWQTAFFVVSIMLCYLRMELKWMSPRYFFALDTAEWPLQLAIYATSLMCIGIPLKIFNNARIELKLEEQERALLQARMEALQSQINPHFLFNTLNSISSLVRFDPDTAREMIVKLASILRRLMGKTEAFVTLREEIAFIDDYLDIEVVRFGPEKLQVLKELDPASLEVMVPSMLLQPLVENSIKHGLSPKIDGGHIRIRSRIEGHHLLLEVEDDGIGMEASAAAAVRAGRTGIGIANVVERLKVLYGDGALFRIRSGDAAGTLVTLTIPAVARADAWPTAAAPAGSYGLRSSTRR